MLSLINEAVILVLAGFVLVSAICRVNLIHASTVRFRYVAVPMIASIWAVSLIGTMLNGDDPSWYQALGLLVPALVLFNDKHEWKNGVPPHAQRSHFVMTYHGGPDAGDRVVRAENTVVLAVILVAVAAAAVGSAAQGIPLRIFSAHSEPIVVAPGAKFDIVYDIRRIRACSGEVDRFIVNSAGSVVQTFERQPLGALRPGKRRTTRVSLVLADLPASTYTFRAVMTHNCPDGRYVQYSPDVRLVSAAVPDPWAIHTAPPGSASLSQTPVVKVPAK